jgi:hypothetical protein
MGQAGRRSIRPGVEQVNDGLDAVTAGALVGDLEQVEGSAHGTSNGVAVAQAVVAVAASSGPSARLSASIWSATGLPELRSGLGWLAQVASGPNSR